MKLLLMERFQRDLTDLSQQDRSRCFELLMALPKAMGTSHGHSGLGIRKLHSSGIFEARVGLGLRVIFALRGDQAFLVRVGSHEDVRKYLTSL
jgi:mRNA-degrading endonuclease RelE of RelBE toxin-antitoxin system